MAQLTQQFNDIKSQIDQQKTGIGQDKATANDNLLKEYRDQQAQLESKWTDYMMQMNANATAAKQQLQAASAQYLPQMGQTPDLNAIVQNPFPTYVPQHNPETGAVISPGLKQRKDLFG